MDNDAQIIAQATPITREPTQTTQEPTQNATQTTQNTTQTTIRSIGARIERDIVVLLENEPGMSQKQIAEQLEINVNTVKYHMRKMKEQGKIEYVGSSHKGHWKVK